MFQWLRICLPNFHGRETWGKNDTSICMVKSFHCSPEAITTLFLNQLYSNTKLIYKKIKNEIICLPMQGPRVWSLVREDSTCRRAIKAMCSNYRTRAPQQEKPLQWGAHIRQLERSPTSLQLQKACCSSKDPAQPKIISKILKEQNKCQIVSIIP